jgi:hypothetical protein
LVRARECVGHLESRGGLERERGLAHLARARDNLNAAPWLSQSRQERLELGRVYPGLLSMMSIFTQSYEQWQTDDGFAGHPQGLGPISTMRTGT